VIARTAERGNEECDVGDDEDDCYDDDNFD